MKAFIHIGMPKTGTSSIQDTFASLDITDPLYSVRTPSNHGKAVRLLFENRAPRGAADPTETDRQRWVQQFDAAFRSGAERVIFSAERFSSLSFASVERVYDFFARHADDVQVVGYVRKPASYMASGFQQVIKNREPRFDIEERWPRYRDRFEPWDQVFGRDKVTLRLFESSQLFEGDVVLDFARIVGAPLAAQDIVRSNDGLSCEAVALLYAQRKLGVTMAGASPRATLIFVDYLRRIGTGRFRFAGELTDPILQARLDDVAWMEKRLGCSLAELSATEGIRSEDHLLQTAFEAAPLLQACFPDGGGTASTMTELAARLDRVYASCIREAGTRTARLRPSSYESVQQDVIRPVARALWHARRDGGRGKEDAQAAWLRERPEMTSAAEVFITELRMHGIGLQRQVPDDRTVGTQKT